MLNRELHPAALGAGPTTRLVERLVLHGEPIGFRELCRRAVPEQARYLILDLDRTVHLGRNMGELLGWELCAYHGYGPVRLAEAEGRRRPGRFFFDWSHPAAVLRYLAVSARMWAGPGLFYLFCGKIPAYLEITRRLSFRVFGPEPVAAVQRLPQTALLHHMAGVPSSTLRALARRVWDRHQGDQVVERDDLAWLRGRCPGIRIVITSASPQPTLEVAAEALGVDDVVYSAIDEHAGYFDSPYELRRLFLAGRPRRLSGPSQVRINSGRAKIQTLLGRYPDLADRRVVSVGMSDTGYGEDHCWAEHFTRVVDLNSETPFPPIVPAGSPVQEIHSAAVLSRAEHRWRAGGDAAYLDPRRAPRPGVDAHFTASELSKRLAHAVAAVEALASRFLEGARDLAGARRDLLVEAAQADARLDALSAAFNEAAGRPGRAEVLRRLRRELAGRRTLRRRLARLERPLSRVACALVRLLAESRAALSAGLLREAPRAPAEEISRET